MVALPKPILTSRRLALGALALGLAGVSGAAATLYLQREAIGVRLAFDYLREHGVPAAIHLDRLDLGGASGSLRLGPALRPDLTVGRVDAQFGALPAPWRGVKPPPVRSLTLTRPVLHLAWRDGRLDFGTLQPLVDQALRAPGGQGGTAPNLYVHDGRLLFDSPAGPLVVALDAAVEGGRVRSLHARLQPGDLQALGVRLAAVQGVLSGDATGRGVLHLSGAFGAERGDAAKGAASGLTLSVEGVIPNGGLKPGDLPERALDATLRLRAGRLALRPVRGAAVGVQAADLTLDLDGSVDRIGLFAGRLHAAGRAGRLQRGPLELAGAAVDLAAPAARGRAGGPHGLEADGGYSLSLAAGGGRLQAGGTAVELAPARLQARGRLALDRRLRLDAAGLAEGGLGLPGDVAARLARSTVGGVDPGSAASLERALRRVRVAPTPYSLAYDSLSGATLRLDRGLRAEVDGGALSLRPEGGGPVLQLARGGAASGALQFALQVQGLPYLSLAASRYRLAPGGEVSADAALQMEGGFGPADDASVRLGGALAGRDGRWTFTAADCARLSASALRSGGRVVATGVRAQACPAGGEPLLAYERGGWRVRTQAREVALTLPGAALRAGVDSAEVSLDGRGRDGPSGQVLLHRALLEDTGASVRVRPLAATGAVSLSGGETRGRLAVALARGDVPLGVVDVRAGARGGEAALDTGPLRFRPGGLQPGDVAPALAHALPQADGAVKLTARYAWSPGGATSSGALSIAGLGFRSPAGKLDGVRGVVRLASLSPLVTLAGQSLTADRLETAIPLTDLRLAYALTPSAVELQGASAQAAGGRIGLGPMRLPLAPAPFATAGVLELRGVDLQRVLDTLNLSNAVTLQAKVDGRLPFALQPGNGGPVLRIADGRIAAEGPGRLTIARRALSGAVATGGAAGAQPNAVQDFAYQALENLAFTTLEADAASRAGGRLGVVFHVVGRHDPASNPPTRIGLLALLRGHAFDKPLPLPKGTPVDLTLDTSLNLDDILQSYAHLGGAGSAAVQP